MNIPTSLSGGNYKYNLLDAVADRHPTVATILILDRRPIARQRRLAGGLKKLTEHVAGLRDVAVLFWGSFSAAKEQSRDSSQSTASKLPPSCRPLSKNASSVSTSPFVTGRR